jgi:predicted N-acetyltransferase YhbS
MKRAPHIRPADKEEAELLSALAFRAKAHWGYSFEFMAACRDELSIPVEDLDSDFFIYRVAEQDGVVVGYYGLERLSASVWELETLFVEPLHMGSGIGRLLMNHAKAIATKAGAEKMLIQSDPNAACFYQAVGSKPAGRRESASIPGRYLPLLILQLVEKNSNFA